MTRRLVVSGTLSSTNGGQPLSGVSIEVGTQAATADSAGRFALTFQPDLGNLPVVISGPTIVTRRTTIGAGATRSLVLDAILDDGGFDAGVPIDNAKITSVAQQVVDGVTAWMGSRFVSTVEAGPDTREGQDGWITVMWYDKDDPTACGRAEAAGTRIWLNYKNTGCRCSRSTMAPAVVVHEVGHTLGFWHTDSRFDVMYASLAGCDVMPSDRERAHAPVAYTRAIGNTDPDSDPATKVFRAHSKVVIE